MKSILLILSILLSISASGQGKAENELRTFLIKNTIDTFILVKSGCTSCLVSYEDTAKVTDTVTIRLLYKKMGQQHLTVFNDLKSAESSRNIKIDIFKFIENNRQVLRKKDKYYKEQNLWKFKAPCLSTFPYEIIEIMFGAIKHRHTIVGRESDDCGTILTNEDWFNVEVNLIKMFDQLIGAR